MGCANLGSDGKGKSFTKKPCNWRLPAEDVLNAGCVINETGHCTRHDCPFVEGYIKRVRYEKETIHADGQKLSVVPGDHRKDIVTQRRQTVGVCRH